LLDIPEQQGRSGMAAGQQVKQTLAAERFVLRIERIRDAMLPVSSRLPRKDAHKPRPLLTS
jgi:hypothetical protein